MSYGGGPGVDPFGGQPFGGWAQPPTYQAPPPLPQPKTNRFATLSVVFAFVFAPVGALLGHLALSEIKKSHENGRDRAIVGLAISYFVILVVIASLIGWAVIRGKDSGSTAASSTSSTAASKSARQLLLDGDELTKLLGQPFRGATGSAHYGGREDVSITPAGATPTDCVSPTVVGHPEGYQSTDVRDYAHQYWEIPDATMGYRVIAASTRAPTLAPWQSKTSA